MHNSDIFEQFQYLNQRLNVLSNYVNQLKKQPKELKEKPVSLSTPEIHTIDISRSEPVKEAKRGRGRPSGPAQLYSLRQAYQIFLERGIIQKRGRGRPRKAS